MNTSYVRVRIHIRVRVSKRRNRYRDFPLRYYMTTVYRRSRRDELQVNGRVDGNQNLAGLLDRTNRV